MSINEIRAVYNDETIRVYQAYCNKIADEVAENGSFGKSFKIDRMTWIKPSFLWMMYRCGWGIKEGQERIIAIDVKREWFDYLVGNAKLSIYNKQSGLLVDDWKKLIKESDIRVQWDPERDICGCPLPYRSIQLGIRGSYVRDYVHNQIVNIEDITDYVVSLREKIYRKEDISLLLPIERQYNLR